MEEKESVLREKYFSAPAKHLVPGRKRTFPLYIYLELNQRLVLRFHPEYELSESLIRSHIDRGIETFWCPNEFQSDWKNYIDLADEDTPASTSSADAPAGATAKDIPRTEEGALAAEVLNSDTLDPDQKRSILAEIGTEMLSLLAASNDDPKEIKKVMEKCNQFSDDVIKVATQSHEMSSVYEDIRLVAESDIEHSTAVATFAVIFAMGAGFAEKELLADVAFAAFLHDVGSVSLDLEILSTPIDQLNDEQRALFRNHVTAGLKFLEDNSVKVTPAVKEIILQHHERFDGKGFPKGLKAFAVSEMAQIVGMADYLHDLLTGQRDGEKRSPADGMNMLQALQSPTGNPTQFNPELFTAISQMIVDAKSKNKASQIVDSVASGV